MNLSLGIDIGTSKIATVIVNFETGELLEESDIKHNAYLTQESSNLAEQDVAQIFDCIYQSLASLNQTLLSHIKVIGLTGQMHGVLLWNSQSWETSNLVTWEDQRCSNSDFLTTLREKTKDTNISDGYGLGTLAWFAKNNPEELAKFDRSSTIMDFVAHKITNNNHSLISPSNAASWGFYNLETRDWEVDKIKLAGINPEILPTVERSFTVLGELSEEYSSKIALPANTPVIISIGDNQASLYSTLENIDEDIALTLGTGGQLSVVMPTCNYQLNPGAEIRPYFNRQYAAVAAVLSGGKSFAWMVEMLDQWTKDLGLDHYDRERIYLKLNELGELSNPDLLEVTPSFQGERYDTSRRGSISNIDYNNFTPGNLFASIIQSTIINIKDMLPEELFTNKTRIVGSGNGLRKLSLVRRTVEKVFGLPLVIKETKEEAAVGAALFAADSLKRH